MSTPRLSDMQAAGFPLGGELLAVDFADTIITSTDLVTDLLADHTQAATWWQLEAGRLPAGARVPAAPPTLRLRCAVRELLDAHLAQRAAALTAVEDLNAAAAAVPMSIRLITTPDGSRQETRWHDEHGGEPALAAVARSAIELLAAPAAITRLRRCANPSCSMLFLAENPRRVWCTANICGNRARVARHYRTHQQGAARSPRPVHEP